MTWPIVVLVLGVWFGALWAAVQIKRAEMDASRPKGLAALFGNRPDDES